MNLPTFEICRRILALWVVMGEPDWTGNDRLRLINLLTQQGQSVSCLPRIFHEAGVIAAPSRPKDKLYERLWKYFCHLNYDNEPTRLEARKKLDALLNKHNLQWNGPNGFTAILVTYWADSNNISIGATVSQTATEDELEFNALDFVLASFEDYYVMPPAYRLITALWAFHVPVYDEFDYTPRLILISPTSSYGKSLLMELLKQIVSHPHLTKNTSVAAIYRGLARDPRRCYLIDEGENQGILTDRVLRSVIDGGYEGGGSIDRADDEFRVHFPCAIAVRRQLHDLPLSILSRSFVLELMKGIPVKRFSKKNPGPDFPFARELVEKWKATTVLNPDPEMPAELLNHKDNKVPNNCRPLISIADSFGEEYGKAARAALIELCAKLSHHDPAIAALNACKAVFDSMDVDRMERKALARAVVEYDDYFSDWRGVNDQGMPHALSSGELSRMLNPLVGKVRHDRCALVRTITARNSGAGDTRRLRLKDHGGSSARKTTTQRHNPAMSWP
jgi:hypothetical protein